MSAQVHTMPNEARALPTNVEAEQALLGAILANNRAYDHVGDLVLPEHFHYAVHGEIFAACARAIEAGRQVDAVSIKHQFEAHEGLAEVGGAGYLAQLVAAVPSIISARNYGEVIRDCALRREQIMVYREQIARAMDMDQDASGQDILEETEARLQRIAETGAAEASTDLGAAFDETMHQMEARHAAGRGSIGLSTGLADLDALIGGLIAPDVIVLAGRPSMGKTSLALNITKGAAQRHLRGEEGAPVAFFSMEMSRQQILLRMIADETGIHAHRLMRSYMLSADELADARRAAARLRRLPLYIDDRSNLSVPAMMARARRFKRRAGLGLVVVDLLKYIRPPDPRIDRHLQLGEVVRALKNLGKALEVPVLLLHQLSRAAVQGDNKRPELQHLRQSGEIEEDADVIMFAHREHYYLKRQEPSRRTGETEDSFKIRYAEWLEACTAIQHEAEIIVAKQRNGPVETARVYFDEALMRFGNLQREGLFDGQD